VTATPVIDGIARCGMEQATAMTVNVAGGANTGTHTVTLKSVYTDDSVYFLATWNDLTKAKAFALQNRPTEAGSSSIHRMPSWRREIHIMKISSLRYGNKYSQNLMNRVVLPHAM